MDQLRLCHIPAVARRTKRLRKFTKVRPTNSERLNKNTPLTLTAHGTPQTMAYPAQSELSTMSNSELLKNNMKGSSSLTKNKGRKAAKGKLVIFAIVPLLAMLVAIGIAAGILALVQKITTTTTTASTSIRVTTSVTTTTATTATASTTTATTITTVTTVTTSTTSATTSTSTTSVTTTTPSPYACSNMTTLVGFDLNGNDLVSSTRSNYTLCCNWCLTQAGCVGFTWGSSTLSITSACYLKNATSTPNSNSGLISAHY